MFKKKMRRSLSVLLAVAVGAANMAALPVTVFADEQAPTAVQTGKYKATLDTSTGSLTFQNLLHTGSGWNSREKAMLPGATMMLDSQGNSRLAAVTVESSLNNTSANGGLSGIKMAGELSGVKSWFFFNDEILCLGAGIENTGTTQDTVINVVDNVLVEKNTCAALTNPANGYRNILDAVDATDQSYSWRPIVDTITQGKHTRNWLTASGLAADGSNKPLEWSYLFSDSITNARVFYRLPTEGTQQVKSLELWVEPVNGAYNYTLGAGGLQSDFNNGTPSKTANQVLSNTKELQAAENSDEGVLAVNKWADGEVMIPNSFSNLTLYQACSVLMQKNFSDNTMVLTVAKDSHPTTQYIDVALDVAADAVEELGQAGALVESSTQDGKVTLKLDTTKMNSPVRIKLTEKKMGTVTGEDVQIVKGDSVQIATPENFSGEVTWSTKFLKYDGTFLRNSGYQKIKRELKEGEVDGTRTAGDADASHLLELRTVADGAVLTGKNKGNVVVVATDSTGQQKQWNVEILHENPANLPTATTEDFAKIRETWRQSLIGSNLTAEEGGTEILQNINQQAETLWNSYAYKGQDNCSGIPWPQEEGAAGNPNIPYADDAVEFRPAFKNVLAMAKAYAAEGGKLYHNAELFDDMVHILDYLCTTCYAPKSQTDNWWTWEIGLPKDLIPALILIYDDLTQEQIMRYTEAMYFFQPDPFHEGVINTASTHGQGYRTAQGANIIDCSTTAVGLGALREDNELVYIGMQASSATFGINTITDSSTIAQVGYASGFYPDGSYLDHSYVPYLGAYGIEFMKGAVKIPTLLSDTPWQYPSKVQKNIESYVVDGFENGIYNGMLLDSLKGRSVSRPDSSNQAAGREAMTIILQLVDAFTEPAKSTTLSALKLWMQKDPAFVESLSGAEYVAVKQRAEEILADNNIEANVSPTHVSYPLMDRAIHRTNDYLFAVSMYSERTQNTEIMNNENRFGWHQNNGMTYLYDADNQYSENYWNTVNPLRLAGTTVAAVNIGNGAPDSSGFAQGGDFRSDESWVGGSSLGNYGISGMSFSGETNAISGDSSLNYAPELKGKKSWFMFDNEIVCLGAGITNKGMDVPVETTIENKKLNADASNAFVVDGQKVQLPAKEANVKELVDRSADLSGTSFENVTWAHLAGTKSIGTGYYFPSANTQIQARLAKTTGNWSDIGTSEGESTQNYLEMWVEHGTNPTDSSYSYVLLPEKTEAETKAYAEHPEIEVLQNTSSIQAVYDNSLKMTGINFWDDNGGTVGDVTSDKAASVILQETSEGSLKIAVSDPTMKNKGDIQITINKPITSEIALDSNASILEKDENHVVIRFAMAGTNGNSCTAECKLAQTSNPEPSAPPINPEVVSYKLVADELKEVPSELTQISELNTVAKIQAKMEAAAKDVAADLQQFSLWDYHLIAVMSDGTQQEVTPENFPKEGVVITLNFPKSASAKDTFVVTHMFTTQQGEHKAGDVETIIPTVTNDGLSFRIHSLSPIGLSWKTEASQSTGGSGQTENGGQSSSQKNGQISSATPANAASSPQTGDSAIPSRILLACLMVAGISIAMIRRKKHSNIK